MSAASRTSQDRGSGRRRQRRRHGGSSPPPCTSDPEIEVVGTASSGRLGLDKIAQLNPDLVTLDIEMPDMDGLETLKELRRRHPKLPVVMFSSLTERGAAITLDALTFGANDYVCKPAKVASPDEAMASVRAQLIPKIKALTGVRTQPRRAGADHGAAARCPPATRLRTPQPPWPSPGPSRPARSTSSRSAPPPAVPTRWP